MDGHIVTFMSSDLISAPLPQRDLLVHVLCMASRTGEDMLETFDTDDEVSSVATNNAGSSEEQTVPELAYSPPYHDRTNRFRKVTACTIL